MRFFGLLLRWTVAAAVPLIFIPIIGEFAIDLAREHGLYERPSETAEGVMTAIQGLIHNPLYQLCAAFALGLSVGVWSHWLASRMDRSKVVDTLENGASLSLIMMQGQDPREISKSNIYRWFVFQLKNKDLLTGAVSTLSTHFFVVFERPIFTNYRRVYSPTNPSMYFNILDLSPRSMMFTVEQDISGVAIDVHISKSPL